MVRSGRAVRAARGWWPADAGMPAVAIFRLALTKRCATVGSEAKKRTCHASGWLFARHVLGYRY
jgi:hypothetical protein